MPDGATVPIQAVATDLDMRPLNGKIEVKNTGKNVLVRSLSGIGQVGALLLMQTPTGDAGSVHSSKFAIVDHEC